jgi:hypothetical protein
MKIQGYNKKINAWVKGKIVKGKDGSEFYQVLDVKQREPNKPFKNIKFAR